MALIKIRGRADAVSVSDDIARQVKARKFGDGVAMAEPHEMVDLGDWSGEYGRITEIEIPRRESVTDRDTEREREALEEKKRMEAWLKLSPAEKADRDVFFEVAYCTRRLGQIKCEIPLEDEKRAYETRLAWYTANPTRDRIPISEYPKDLLPAKGASARDILADNMRVDYPPDIEANF